MSQSPVEWSGMEASGDDVSPVGLIYRCVNRDVCGLRFPVTPTDPFQNRCPRCGSAVELMARNGVGDAGNVVPILDQRSLTYSSIAYPPSNLYLLLDNWRSLFNVGAAFRTADGAGVRHLYLCGITATPENQRKLAKTSLGAEQAVAWSHHFDAVHLAETLRSEGAQLWVLERNAVAQSLFDINSLPINQKVILAGGNEVVGVDPGLVEIADRVVYLPMMGVKGSLNVAVALSIAAYWLRAKEVNALHAGFHASG